MLDRMLLYRRAQRGNPNFQFLILKQILIFQFLNFIMFRNWIIENFLEIRN